MRLVALLLLAVSAAWGQLPNNRQSAICRNVGTCAFSANVVSGNLLVVGFTYETGSSISISDTVGSSWTSVQTDTVSSVKLASWVASAASSGADTVTITVTGATFHWIQIAEFTNVTATVDASIKGTFSGTPATVTTSNVTTNVGQDLLVCIIGGFRSSGVFNTGTESIFLSHLNGNDAAAAEFRVSGNPGTFNATFGNSVNDVGTYVLMAIKASSAIAIASPAATPDAARSVAYAYTVLASGGAASYTFSITSGSLPTGLSISSGGVISGTATAGCTSCTFNVHVSDGTNTADKSMTMHVGSTASTPAFVQGAGTSGSGNPTTKAFTSNVTSGNVLIVSITANAGSADGRTIYNPVVTDTRTTAYTLINTSSKNASNTQQIYTFAGVAPSSGADTVSISSSTFSTGITISEFSGVQGFYENNILTVGSTASPATITSSSLTTLVPNEMLYSAACGFTAAGTIAINSPYTVIITNNNSGGFGTGYNAATTVTGYTSSFAMASNTNGAWQIDLMGLRPSVSGTPPPDTGVKHKVIRN